MRLKTAVGLLMIGYVLALQTCPSYKCTDTFKDGCSLMVDNTIQLKPCPSPKICDFNIGLHKSQCEASIKSRYPGEYCDNPGDCLKGECKDHRCTVGNKECATDLDCGPQHFCETAGKTCVRTASEGKECGPLKKCDAGLACGDSKCVKVGSLKENDKAILPAACSTLHIRQGKCAQGPKLVRNGGEGPAQCDKECQYKYSDNTTFPTGCVCELSSDPKLLCNPGIGDVDIKDVLPQ